MDGQAAAALSRRLKVDPSPGVRRCCAEALRKLTAAALSPHAAVLVGALDDADSTVGAAAAMTLMGIEAGALAAHAATLVRKLGDPFLREAMVHALSRVDAACFALQASAIVQLTAHPEPEMRVAALTLCMRHGPSTLPAHLLPSLLHALDDAEPEVRAAAVDAVGAMEQKALERQADALLRMFGDEVSHVRAKAIRALAALGPEALASHAEWIDGMTTRISENAEGDGDARKAAVEVLGTLQPAMLATHEAAVAALLEAILHDTAAYVRATAVQCVGKSRTHTHTRTLARRAACLSSPQLEHQLWTICPATASSHAASACRVFSQLDASQLTEEQAKAFEKHTMGKCFAKAQYNGKQAAICF